MQNCRLKYNFLWTIVQWLFHLVSSKWQSGQTQDWSDARKVIRLNGTPHKSQKEYKQKGTQRGALWHAARRGEEGGLRRAVRRPRYPLSLPHLPRDPIAVSVAPQCTHDTTRSDIITVTDVCCGWCLYAKSCITIITLINLTFTRRVIISKASCSFRDVI